MLRFYYLFLSILLPHVCMWLFVCISRGVVCWDEIAKFVQSMARKSKTCRLCSLYIVKWMRRDYPFFLRFFFELICDPWCAPSYDSMKVTKDFFMSRVKVCIRQRKQVLWYHVSRLNVFFSPIKSAVKRKFARCASF